MEQRDMVKTTHARNPDLWEQHVNSKWNGEQPILSAEESILAAKKLYRHIMKKEPPYRIRITSGNRYTWVRRGVLSINPDKREMRCRGLRALIHDLSHWCHSRLHPGDSAHSKRQMIIERRMVAFAIKRDWGHGGLKKPEPAPKPEPEPKAKPDVVVDRYLKMVKRRDKWAADLERAKRLHAKAEKEARQYLNRNKERLKEVAA
jgi:hypothetical protein